MSISLFLEDQFGIFLTPGRKTQCPICFSTKPTFSLRRSDDLVKCFRCQAFARVTDSGTVYASWKPSPQEGVK